ncbi:heme exporter protein CcmD [Varunaivibrio sulfuroxidans]
MGGYAAFVWPSFILTAVVLVVMGFVSWRAMKKNESELKELQGAPRRSPRDAPATPPAGRAPKEHA